MKNVQPILISHLYTCKKTQNIQKILCRNLSYSKGKMKIRRKLALFSPSILFATKFVRVKTVLQQKSTRAQNLFFHPIPPTNEWYKRITEFNCTETLHVLHFPVRLFKYLSIHYTNSINRGSPAAITLISFMNSCSLDTFHG